MPAPTICLSIAEYPPRPGGVAVGGARLARFLADAGYGVHVVAPVPAPGAAGEVESRDEDGITVHRVSHADFASGAGQFAVRQAVQRLDAAHGFALFHGFFLTAAYPCLGPAARGRRPLVASIRGNDVVTLLEQPLTRAVLLPVLRAATWVTSVNEAYLARVAEEVDVEGRSSVIRSGIVSPVGGDAEWKPGEANRGQVGTVGEFRKVKDVPLLVRAYAGVPGALRRGLLLAGFFSDRDEAEWTATLVNEFGLEGDVTLTGPFANAEVGTHLARMHVYVQSSGHEGLPNALLEAASRGVPIVATAVGGMREVLVDGESALLVPHGDPAAMTAAIRRVLEDDALAARLSAGGRALAARFSPDQERDAWLSLYERLLAGGSKPQA
ncbi:MAG: glycosyltransferase family 4 protein [Vicinamibacterales bacterium]